MTARKKMLKKALKDSRYRAWYTEEKKMYLVLGLDWFNQKVMIATNGIPIWYPIDDLFILMQYSGLHDRKHTSEYPKGQGIYVGDIIQFPFLLKQENGETQETIIKDVVAFERESGMFIVAKAREDQTPWKRHVLVSKQGTQKCRSYGAELGRGMTAVL